MDVSKLRTTSGRTMSEVWKGPTEPGPEPELSDLEFVCDIAMEWAGEYGFVDRDRAMRVSEAVVRLCPQLVIKNVEATLEPEFQKRISDVLGIEKESHAQEEV